MTKLTKMMSSTQNFWEQFKIGKNEMSISRGQSIPNSKINSDHYLVKM